MQSGKRGKETDLQCNRMTNCWNDNKLCLSIFLLFFCFWHFIKVLRHKQFHSVYANAFLVRFRAFDDNSSLIAFFLPPLHSSETISISLHLCLSDLRECHARGWNCFDKSLASYYLLTYLVSNALKSLLWIGVTSHTLFLPVLSWILLKSHKSWHISTHSFD